MTRRNLGRLAGEHRVTAPCQCVGGTATGVGSLEGGPVAGDTTRGVDHERAVLHTTVRRVGRSRCDGHMAGVPLTGKCLVQGDALRRQTLLVWRQQVGIGRVVAQTLAEGIACEGTNVVTGHLTLLGVSLGRSDRVVCDVLVEAAVNNPVVRVVLPLLDVSRVAGGGRSARSRRGLTLCLVAADVLAGRLVGTGGCEADRRQNNRQCGDGREQRPPETVLLCEQRDHHQAEPPRHPEDE